MTEHVTSDGRTDPEVAERNVKDWWWQTVASIGLGVALPAAIGMLWLAGFRTVRGIEAMTWGFLIVGPFVLGFLTGVTIRTPSLARRFWLPWLTILAFMGGAFATGWEGAICILMALPAALPLASLGGLSSAWLVRKQTPRPPVMVVACMLPFVVAAIEAQFELPSEVRPVATFIEIDASADVVWREIVNVRKIGNRSPLRREPGSRSFGHRSIKMLWASGRTRICGRWSRAFWPGSRSWSVAKRSICAASTSSSRV